MASARQVLRREPDASITEATRLVGDLRLESVQVLELVVCGRARVRRRPATSPVVTVADLVDAIEARS